MEVPGLRDSWKQIKLRINGGSYGELWMLHGLLFRHIDVGFKACSGHASEEFQVSLAAFIVIFCISCTCLTP